MRSAIGIQCREPVAPLVERDRFSVFNQFRSGAEPEAGVRIVSLWLVVNHSQSAFHYRQRRRSLSVLELPSFRLESSPLQVAA